MQNGHLPASAAAKNDHCLPDGHRFLQGPLESMERFWTLKIYIYNSLRFKNGKILSLILHTVAIWTFSFHQNSVKKSDDFVDLTLAQ